MKLLLLPDYSLVVWEYVAYTFAMGGFAFWRPAYLMRVGKMTQVQAGFYFGSVIAVSGLLGTFAGGFAATAWRKRNPAAYALVLGILTLLAVPCAAWAFLGGTTTALQWGLTIANHGTVYDNRGYIGSNASASNNTVLVTGSGSIWNNSSDIQSGHSGVGNTLLITNCGTVSSSGGTIGQLAGASNNFVLITGSSSVWSNSGDFFVGSAGVGNQLTLTNGGTMHNRRGVIGSQATGSNNVVLVTGTASVWNNSSYLYVGNLGSGNQFAISSVRHSTLASALALCFAVKGACECWWCV